MALFNNDCEQSRRAVSSVRRNGEGLQNAPRVTLRELRPENGFVGSRFHIVPRGLFPLRTSPESFVASDATLLMLTEHVAAGTSRDVRLFQVRRS